MRQKHQRQLQEKGKSKYMLFIYMFILINLYTFYNGETAILTVKEQKIKSCSLLP